MPFRRRSHVTATGPAGPVRSGLEAALEFERRIGAATAAEPEALGPAVAGDPLAFSGTAASAVAYAVARAAAGDRSAAVVRASVLDSALASLGDAVRRRIPMVVHVVADGPWDGIFHAGETGAVILASTDVRDVPTLAVAARRAAEEVLLPVLCVYDAHRHAHAVADVAGCAAEAAESLFPESRAAPDAAQRLLLGAERPSVPAWIDPARPMGLGATLEGMDRLAAEAARRLLLDPDVGAAVDRALATAGDAMERRLGPVVAAGPERATVVFVTAGEAPPTGRSFRSVSCVRLFPIPGEAVRERVGWSRAAVLLPAAPGPYAGRISALLESALAAPVPVGMGPFAFDPDQGADLEEAAARLLSNRLTDPFFTAVWRPLDRPSPPEAERLEQRLRAWYPGFDRALVHPASPRLETGRYVVLAGPALGPLVAAEFAPALAAASSVSVRAFAVRRHARASAVALASGDAASAPPSGRAAAIAAESAADLDRLGLMDFAGAGTRVVVPDPDALSAEVVVRLRATGARLERLEPVTGARLERLEPATGARLERLEPATGARPERLEPGAGARLERLESTTGELSVPLALAVCVLSPGLADAQASEFSRRVVAALVASGRLADAHAEGLLAGIGRTTSEACEIPAARAEEPGPPSDLRDAEADSDRADDPIRFWKTHGFAHASGRTSELIPDPYRALGALPARAGWNPEGSGHPAALPRLVPGRCTACGDCWTLCPESAIVPAAPTFEEALDAAFSSLDSPPFQLMRLRKALAQEVRRTFGADALCQFQTLDALTTEALERVMIRGRLDDAKRDQLRGEYATLAPHVPPLPLARTDAWFNGPEGAAKGSGRPFLLAVDPDRCSSCGLCVVACPEAALEPVEPGAPPAAARSGEAGPLPASAPGPGSGAGFARRLPPPPPDLVPSGTPRLPETARMDAVSTRSDALQATLHAAVLCAAEVVGAARDRFLARSAAVRASLETAAARALSGAVRINDFDAFAKRLAALGDDVPAERLLAALPDDGGLDAGRVRRLADAAVRLAELEKRWSEPDTGRGRSPLVTVFDGPAPSAWPVNPFGFPWMSVPPGAGSPALRALLDGLEARHAVDVHLLREGERLAKGIEDDPAPEPPDPVERTAAPAAVCVTERLDADALELLSGSRRVRVILLVGGPLDAPDSALAAAAIGTCFVAQATVGRPRELVDSFARAFAHDGPSLVRCLVPAGDAADAFVRASEAVAARVFPVFRFDPASDESPAGRFDLAGNPAPAVDFADAEQDPIAWLARDPEATRSWTVVRSGEAPPGLVAARDALSSPDPACRVGVSRAASRTALVPAPVVEAARRRLASWRRLRSMAAAAQAAADSRRPPAESGAPLPAAAEVLPTEIHARLTARLLALSGFAPGDPRSAHTLRSVLAGSDAPAGAPVATPASAGTPVAKSPSSDAPITKETSAAAPAPEGS